MDKKRIEKKYINPGEIYEPAYNTWPLYNADIFVLPSSSMLFLE